MRLLLFLPGRYSPGFFASLACVLASSAIFKTPSTSGGGIARRAFLWSERACVHAPAMPVKHAPAGGRAAQRPSAESTRRDAQASRPERLAGPQAR